MTTLAFIGFGAMGRPMVRHLLAAGHRINVSVRRPEAADAVKALGAQPCHSPAEAARDADVVFTNVTSTTDVEEVLFGPQGVVEGARPGTLCIDHSTISPVATRHIAERLQAAGLRFLDAPVSGGAAGAEAATLTIMVGGDSADLEQARPLLERLGKTIAHVGGPGSGQVAKACNQMVQVTTIQGIAEAMLFATSQGTDPQKILDAISTGFAGSRMLDLMGPKMAQRDFKAGIEARLHEKDFGLVRDVAQEQGLHLPAMEAVAAQLRALVEQGRGRDDTSSLLPVLESQQPAKR